MRDKIIATCKQAIRRGFGNYYANGEGRKKTFLDWRRTWQGWCRRDIDFRGDPKKRGGRTESDDRAAIVAALADELAGERDVAGGGDGGVLGAAPSGRGGGPGRRWKRHRSAGGHRRKAGRRRRCGSSVEEAQRRGWLRIGVAAYKRGQLQGGPTQAM